MFGRLKSQTICAEEMGCVLVEFNQLSDPVFVYCSLHKLNEATSTPQLPWMNKIYYFFQLGKWNSPLFLYTNCYRNLVDWGANSCSYDVHEVGALFS